MCQSSVYAGTGLRQLTYLLYSVKVSSIIIFKVCKCEDLKDLNPKPESTNECFLSLKLLVKNYKQISNSFPISVP